MDLLRTSTGRTFRLQTGFRNWGYIDYTVPERLLCRFKDPHTIMWYYLKKAHEMLFFIHHNLGSRSRKRRGERREMWLNR